MKNKRREYTTRYMNYKRLYGECFKKKVFETDNKHLMMSEVSLYSSTCAQHAEATSKKIADIMGTNNIVITDATAHIGGNTYNFAKNFKQVNAVEINKGNYDMLVNNMKILKVVEKIDFKCQDYTMICKSLKQDVIFIDPPWGGPEYKYKESLDISLSKIDLSDVILSVVNNAKLIVIKLPFNYNFNRLIKKLNNKVKTIIIDQMVKKTRPVMMTYVVV